MDQLIPFMLKSVMVCGILYTWYLFALKGRRLHNYNRFFLLFTLYASIQVPMLRFNWLVQEKSPVMLTSARLLLHTLGNAGSTQPAAQYAKAAAADWKMIVFIGAGLISAALLVTMLIRIICILRVGKRYPRTVADGVTLVHTDLHNAPFSFMNTIYWRIDLAPDTETGRMILKHELAHIRQRHSLDKLACQLLTCIFWMDPFYWLIRKELSVVHEFLADEQAMTNDNESINEHERTDAFARMLLQVHDHNDFLTPEHQFYSSSIKRRLTMLQKNKRVSASVLRRVMVLPLVAGSIFIFAFSPRTAPMNENKKAANKIVLVVDAGHGGNDEGCRSGSLLEKDLTLKVARRMKELAPRYNVEVHLTRSSDKNITLEERVAFANKLQPDGFISIHIDDQPNGATGKGTFDIAINDQNAKVEESKKLAYAVYKQAAQPDWKQTNGPSEKSAYVLRENTTAAVLIELGDIKNRGQMQYIQSDAKLDELCSRILEGVVEAHNK